MDEELYWTGMAINRREALLLNKCKCRYAVMGVSRIIYKDSVGPLGRLVSGSMLGLLLDHYWGG